MRVEIDFSKIEDLNSMHELLKQKFGFPNFYGKNVNALIDCWSSLRHPEDEMAEIALEKDETLDLVVKCLLSKKGIIVNNFLISILSVNQRYIRRNESPPINLILI